MNEIIEELKKAYDAFNRGAIKECLDIMDPEVEWIEPSEFIGGGKYHGHKGVEEYLTQSRKAWAEIHSEPDAFIIAGDKIVVFVHATIRPEGADSFTESKIADVYTIKDGKVISMQAFIDRQEAIKYAENLRP